MYSLILYKESWRNKVLDTEVRKTEVSYLCFAKSLQMASYAALNAQAGSSTQESLQAYKLFL